MKNILVFYALLMVMILIFSTHAVQSSQSSASSAFLAFTAGRDSGPPEGSDYEQDEQFAPGGTIFTASSDNHRNLKFKKDRGDDLDQYLYRSSGPLDVFVGIGDLRPDPAVSQKSKLTLRYFDVDRTGPSLSTCNGRPEIDKVKVNGHQLAEELTGRNQQWNIKTYDIEPGWLVMGDNHVIVDIDTLETGCWALEVDWVEIKIPFNIKVVKVEAFDDLDIRDSSGNPIPNVIWEKMFDSSGRLVDTSPATNYPIADWLRSNKLKLKVTVDAWPKMPPDFTPKISHSWINNRILGNAPQIKSGRLEFSGWTREFEVRLPRKVGRREISQRFVFKKPSGEIVHSTRQTNARHKLYVTIEKAQDIIGIGGPNPNIPRENWLNIVTRWAVDSSTDRQGLEGIFNNEYGMPPNEFGWRYPDDSIAWNRYKGIDDTIEGANCYVHRNVLRAFAGALGVNTGSNNYVPGVGFMTGTRPALDNNLFAPARNTATGSFDRWVFGSHAQATFGGQIWDVTFGRTYAAADDAAFCQVNASLGGGMYSCKRSDDLSRFCTIRPTGPGAPAGKDGWTLYDYTCSPVPPISASIFPGSFSSTSDFGIDIDNDTLFDFLVAQFEVNVETAGIYGIDGSLLSPAGNLISIGSLEQGADRALQGYKVFQDLKSGSNLVTLFFSGRQIFDSGEDGPYFANLTLLDGSGSLVNSTGFFTNPYNFTQFQGLKILINSVSDFGNDTDGDGQFDFITVNINADILGMQPVNAEISGFLEKDSQRISSDLFSSTQTPGSKTIQLNFHGSEIRQKRLDGPYQIVLSISDGIFTQIQTSLSAAYSHTQFEVPPAEFSLAFSDSGIDLNGNGKFDTLNVDIGVIAKIAGNYTVLGTIADSAGIEISSAENSSSLSAGQNTLRLQFNGNEIFRSRSNGPYSLVFLALLDEAGRGVDFLEAPYNTTQYLYTDFDPPGAVFTGEFQDFGVDKDSDSFFDILKINVGVNVSVPARYLIEADLSAGDTTIDEISFESFLPGCRSGRQKLPSCSNNISLSFSGEKIFSSGIDGPYNISFLRISRVGVDEGSVEDQLEDAFSTAPFSFEQFQRPAVIFSAFSDTGIDTNSNNLFDILRIEMTIETKTTADYSISGSLVDSRGNAIEWSSNHTFFNAGIPQQISLDFDGMQINANQQDGPYFLKDLSAHDISGISGEPVVFLEDAHTTAAYNFTQFEPPGNIEL